MPIAPQPFLHQSPPPADADALPGRQAGNAEELAIPSERLLRGQACVTIDHEGIQYVLRATRAGKLILTK